MKSSTVVIALEVAFLGLVLIGYWVLSSNHDEQLIAPAPKAESETNVSEDSNTNEIAAIDDSDSRTETIESQSVDLGLPTVVVREPDRQIADGSSVDLVLPSSVTSEPASLPAQSTPAAEETMSDSGVAIGPTIPLQLVDQSLAQALHGLRTVVGNARSTDQWWWPENSNQVFALHSQDTPPALYSISLLTSRFFKLASLPRYRYFDAKGNDSEIHLLRVDTLGQRYRLVADVFSLQTIRIAATRTLLDLPLSSSRRIERVIWEPGLSSIALTLQWSDASNAPAFHTNVVDLESGLVTEFPDGEYSASHALPLGFSKDGQRLILASPVSTEKTADGGEVFVLIEADLSRGQTRKFGNPALPRHVPFQISRNARWAAYAVADDIQVWDTKTGRMHAFVSSDVVFPRRVRHPRLVFAANDSWFACDDGRSLKFYSADTGKSLSVFSEDGVVRENPLGNIRTLFSMATDSGLLLCSFDAGIPSATSPRTANAGRSRLPWLKRLSVGGPEAEIATDQQAKEDQSMEREGSDVSRLTVRSDAKFTNWMSSEEYNAAFRRLTASRRYPVTVEGRVELGHRQYRAHFVDRPENLEFVTHHDLREEAIAKVAQWHQQSGFSEIWRQSFVDENGMTWWSGIWKKTVEPEN